MKKIAFVGLLVAAFIGMGSCGAPRPQQVYADDTDSTEVEEDMVPRDHTVYGLCGNGSSMNTLELLTDNGDTLVLSMAPELEANKVFGR